MPTDRTTFHRKAERGSHDRAAIDAILDEAYVCHVAFLHDGAPIVLPTTHVRVGDHLYVHGAAGGRFLRTLAAGVRVSVAVTLLDGLVLARTAFHHSVNYRSVVVFGDAALVTDAAEKRRVLAALLDRMAPGRSRACRPPSDSELAGTHVIAVPLAEASAKTRSGPPLPEAAADRDLPYWAGVIPIVTSRGAAVEGTE